MTFHREDQQQDNELIHQEADLRTLMELQHLDSTLKLKVEYSIWMDTLNEMILSQQ